MIKMVASDLDGTLLNNKKEFPPHFDDVVRQLEDKGIVFVAASGRGGKSLKQILGDMPVAMVADNGATAYNTRGERIIAEEFTYEKARIILDTAAGIPYMTPAVISAEDVYVQDDSSDAVKDFMVSYFRGLVTFVPDIVRIFEKEAVVKMSINTGPDGSNEDEGLALIRQLSDYFGYTLSGDGWVDVQRSDVNKGKTVLTMGEHYGISPDEIMVFGDYLNDYEFMQATPNSYAMKNAHPRIKEISRYITEYTNEEYGVIRELMKLFDIRYDQIV